MIKNFIRYIPFILLFVIATLVLYFYNSKLNLKNQSESNLIFNHLLKKKIDSLTVLESDTDNILDFTSDVSDYLKKKRKRYFWNLLKPSQ